MANTLGAAIGLVQHTFKTTLADGETSVTVKLGFDFTSATDADIKSWLVSNRIIAFQRPARLLTASELGALDGQTIIATNAGQKIQSKHAKITSAIATLRALGETSAADELEAKYNEKLESEKTE